MRLKEYEGKKIFSKYNISVPRGFLISKLSDLNKNLKKLKLNEYTVKAQLLIGKRGKLGAVKFANKKSIRSVCSSLFEKTFDDLEVKELLIEEKYVLKEQIYLGVTLSRQTDNYVLIYSNKGGADIEEISVTEPNSIKKNSFFKPSVKDLIELFSKSKYKKDLIKISQKLFQIMIDYDAILVEINPLIFVKNKIIALDSKIILDDNALFRHSDFI